MKKKKLLIITIAIIIVIVLIFIFALRHNSKESNAKKEIKTINNLSQEYSDYILPLNRDELMDKYDGELSNETIYVFLYRFAKDILPELRKEKISNSNDYFSKNKEYIYITLGIDNAEDFNGLINKINELESSDLKFTKYQIEEKSARKYGTKTDAKMVITYNDNEDIVIDISVSKKQKDNITSVSFK